MEMMAVAAIPPCSLRSNLCLPRSKFHAVRLDPLPGNAGKSLRAGGDSGRAIGHHLGPDGSVAQPALFARPERQRQDVSRQDATHELAGFAVCWLSANDFAEERDGQPTRDADLLI